MSDRDKQEAADKAARAARQVKHAASNAADAVEASAHVAKDEIVDGAERAKGAVEELAKRAVYTEAGRGILAISLALISGGVGVQKLKNARQMSRTLRANLANPEV